MIDPKTGMVSFMWSKWFSGLYIQTGGSASTSFTSLITTVQEQALEITALQNTVAQLTNEFGSLTVGRQL